MPIYRYKCDHCGYEFTILESFNGNSVRECPQCGQQTARRLISRVGIIYKGSGFHNTDYRRNGSRGGRAEGRRDGQPESEGAKHHKEHREGEQREREPVSEH